MMFNDGQETIRHFESTLDQLYQRLTPDEPQVLWPIPLLIVDINMPCDGLQVTTKVKELYAKINQKLWFRNEVRPTPNEPPIVDTLIDKNVSTA